MAGASSAAATAIVNGFTRTKPFLSGSGGPTKALFGVNRSSNSRVISKRFDGLSIMASIQEVRIPASHQADISEIMMEKKALLLTITKAYTEASMRNRTPGNLTLINSNNYSGKPIGPFPATIAMNRTQGFDHVASITSDPSGSVGYVVYSGTNYAGAGGEECAWLMAWSNPISSTDIKIYVETGLVAPYQPGVLDLDKVKQKLDASTNESYYKDQGSGAEASAQIEIAGQTAEIAAVFKVAF